MNFANTNFEMPHNFTTFQAILFVWAYKHIAKGDGRFITKNCSQSLVSAPKYLQINP